MGRPSQFKELAPVVIAGLSKGTPLTVICAEIGVTDDTVRNWQAADEEFSRAIARARLTGFDVIAMETLEIADDGTNDWMEKRSKDGSTYYELNGEHVTRSKLRVETRLKLLAKWDPKRYGDKTAIVGGGPEDAPVQMLNVKSPRERAKALAFLLAKQKSQPD